jgi:RNA polymerase sigma factor (sigma-70 family)
MKFEVDEKELVKSVLSKDKAAFKQLIRQYEGLVIHIVVPLIDNQSDRDDICQDVFLKVYEKLHTFQFKSKLSTWIGNIAYNTSINLLQKKRNVLLDDIFSLNRDSESDSHGQMSAEVSGQDPEAILIITEEKKLLQAAVDRLPAIQKTLILLFHQDELPLDEIGAMMNMPVNTVKSHLFRARATLKGMLVQQKIKGDE